MCVDIDDPDPLAHSVRLELSDGWVEMIATSRDLQGHGGVRSEALLTAEGSIRVGRALIAVGEAALQTGARRP